MPDSGGVAVTTCRFCSASCIIHISPVSVALQQEGRVSRLELSSVAAFDESMKFFRSVMLIYNEVLANFDVLPLK